MLVVGKSAKSSVRLLADAGISATACQNAFDVLRILRQDSFRTILSDLRMPDMDGIELMARVREEFPEIAFVLITEPDDLRHGILAMISGASDYIVAPLHPCTVRASRDRALKRKRLESAISGHSRRTPAMALG